MSLGTAFIIVIIIVLGGIAAAYIWVIAPTYFPSGHDNREIIIPLAELSSIWVRYNEEIVPLSMRERTGTGGTGEEADMVERLWNFDDETKSPEGQPVVVTPVPANPEDPVPAAPAKPVSAPVPVPAATRQETVQELNIADLEQSLTIFWKECINPYKEQIQMQEAEGVIMDLLRILSEHGNHPSIVIDNSDEESCDLISVRDNLAQVSLRDHTYTVARVLVKSIKEKMIDHESLVPSALIMALAHDIGKIPEFRASRAYNTKDHAHVSANKLAELLAGRNEFWVKKVIDAVRNHHGNTKDDLTIMLKQADRDARQMELVAHTRIFEIKPFDEWFNVKEYITTYLLPGINVDKTGKWNAFTFRGTVYAKPDWMYKQGRRMCYEKKALDLSFIYEIEKTNATRKIVSALRKEHLTPLLGDNYYAQKFNIKTKMGGKKQLASFLTPWTIPDYIDLSELEARKAGFLEIIEAVKPAN